MLVESNILKEEKLEIRLKNVILSMVLVFSLIFSTLSFQVMATEQHSIDITESTGNGIFGCSLKVKTMDQLKKIRGIKVNGKTFTEVSKKIDLTSGGKYNLSETDPDIFLSAVKDNDKVEITTDTEKVTVTVKNAEAFGNMHDSDSIRYSPINSVGDGNTVSPKPPTHGETQNPPAIHKDTEKGKFTPVNAGMFGYFGIKIESLELLKKVNGVRVGSRDYVRDSKFQTWVAGKFAVEEEDSTVYFKQPDDGETIVLSFDDSSKKAFKYHKKENKLEALNEIPKAKELKVRLRGSFEPAVVGQKHYDGVSGASSSATINRNSNVFLEAVEVEPGTKMSDIPERDWKPISELNKVRLNAGKSKISISGDSGMKTIYSYLTSQVTLDGIPKKDGTYNVKARVVDEAGRVVESNRLEFKVYDTEKVKLIDRLKTDNAKRVQDGKYIWDMEPWAIRYFGGKDETVTVPKDIKAWYGSHTSGTYGVLGYPVPTNAQPKQTLIVDKDTDLTLVNMKILSSVKIVVKKGGRLNVMDSVIYGKITVEDGGTLSMNYDRFKKKFVTGGSIVGTVEVQKGGILENAYIYSHANYLADGKESRQTAEPVVKILGDATIKGQVHVKGEDSSPGPIPGQTGISVENGAVVTVTEGSVLAGYGGGESALTRDGGTGILLQDGAKVTGPGKLVAVGGTGFGFSAHRGAGGIAVDGNGTVDTQKAYLQGGNINTTERNVGKPYGYGVKITSKVIGVANKGKVATSFQPEDQPAYWKDILHAPNSDATETGNKLINGV